MDKNTISEVLKKVKESSKERKFTQSYDLIVNFKNLDLKKTENHVDFFTNLHHSKGKKIKVCALVGPELKPSAKANCDNVIDDHDFPKYNKDKKAVKKLAKEYDYFVAQANIMPKIATTFGKVLGVRGKMPNPKAGCIVPPKADLKPLVSRLQKLVRVRVKKDPLYQTIVGNEKMKDEEVIDNIITLYNALITHLPNEKNNIRNILLKTTMGKPIKLM